MHEDAKGPEQTEVAASGEQKPKRVRKPRVKKTVEESAPAVETTTDKPVIETEAPVKEAKSKSVKREATAAEKAVIDAKVKDTKRHMCYMVNDRGDVAQTCPNPRDEKEKFCQFHGGKAIQPPPMSDEEIKNMATKTSKTEKKAKKFVMPKKAEKKARKAREQRAVLLNKSSKWADIKAPQRGSIIDAIQKSNNGGLTADEIAKKVSGRKAWENMEKKGLLVREVRTTVSNLVRLGFLRYA